MKGIKKVLFLLVLLLTFTSCGYYKGIILFSTDNVSFLNDKGEKKEYTYSNNYSSFLPGESKTFIANSISYGINYTKSEEVWRIRIEFKKKKANIENIKIEAINEKGQLVPIFETSIKLDKKGNSEKVPEGFIKLTKDYGTYYWDADLRHKKIDLKGYGAIDSKNRSTTLLKFTIKPEGKDEEVFYQPVRLPVETPYSQNIELKPIKKK